MATRTGLVRRVYRRLLTIDRSRDQVARNVGTQVILKENLKIGIVGIPMEHGQRKIGVGQGPDAIRGAGLLEALADHRGLEVKDYGNIPINMMTSPSDRFPSENVAMRNVKANAEANLQTASTVTDILGSNDVCVALGGDHSMAIGTISGHAAVNPNLSILWVDAHPDLNVPSSSPSGNIHGMPLHFILADLQNKRLPIPAFEWCKANISSSNIGMIAIRDIDPGEIELMKRFNIPHCSIREIDRNGIAHCMEMILDMINPCGNRPLHLSFDIDSLDPLIAPSTGTPVHGGLSHREAMYVCEEVARTGCLTHLDLVEVNPDIGTQKDAEVTAKVAVDVITHALGLSIRDTDYRRFPLIHRELNNKDD